MSQAFWASILFYNLSLTCTKISILLQYKRVFISKTFQKVCIAVIIACLIYGTYGTITAIWACRPISAFWTKDPSAKCLNQLAIWYVNAGINIATDFTIIILPIPVIRHLQLAPRQKHALIAVFGFGGV